MLYSALCPEGPRSTIMEVRKAIAVLCAYDNQILRIANYLVNRLQLGSRQVRSRETEVRLTSDQNRSHSLKDGQLRISLQETYITLFIQEIEKKTWYWILRLLCGCVNIRPSHILIILTLLSESRNYEQKKPISSSRNLAKTCLHDRITSS